MRTAEQVSHLELQGVTMGKHLSNVLTCLSQAPLLPGSCLHPCAPRVFHAASASLIPPNSQCFPVCPRCTCLQPQCVPQCFLSCQFPQCTLCASLWLQCTPLHSVSSSDFSAPCDSKCTPEHCLCYQSLNFILVFPCLPVSSVSKALVFFIPPECKCSPGLYCACFHPSVPSSSVFFLVFSAAPPVPLVHPCASHDSSAPCAI